MLGIAHFLFSQVVFGDTVPECLIWCVPPEQAPLIHVHSMLVNDDQPLYSDVSQRAEEQLEPEDLVISEAMDGDAVTPVRSSSPVRGTTPVPSTPPKTLSGSSDKKNSANSRTATGNERNHVMNHLKRCICSHR